tara:strand:- start:225 stop:1112 length:888 start_codon:yes stop_codon:yes gene_type:complete
MSLSHKYRTFDQLLEDVTVDFRTYALEGMVEPQQLIKVAMRVNYDLGLKIQRTKNAVVDIENGKGKLPSDFYSLNYGSLCGTYKIKTTQPSGTNTELVDKATYKLEPGYTGPCDDPEAKCDDVCVIRKDCDNNELMLVQKLKPDTYRIYNYMIPINIKDSQGDSCNECPIYKGADDVEIRDGFLITNFKSGKIYISYQGTLEDENGELLVLDHPYCNEYYEYALKERILENMLFAGENTSQQLGMIAQRLRAARNNALSFVNTPDFAQLKRLWEKNRKAQYHNYYNMFKSTPTIS